MAIDFEKLKANAKKKDEATYAAQTADFAKSKKLVSVPATKPTPLLTAFSTGKTSGLKTNTGTNYKPLSVPTSAQKMASLGVDFKPTVQSQINTVNGISNKTITPTPIIPANTLLNKVQFTSDKIASGAIGAAKGLVNEIGYLGQGAAQGMYASEASKLKLADAGNKTVSPVTQNMSETAQKLANTPLKNSVEWGKDFGKSISGYGYDNDKTMQTIGNVASGVGGMIPAAVSNFIVPGSSMFVMASGAAGNATEEAVKRGADTGSALAYGAAIGVTEAATEKLFNGVAGVFGKGAADDVIKGLVKSVSKNPTTQKAITMLADTLGEGFEEWLTEYAEAYENKLLINQDSRSFKDISSDALYSAAIGSLVSVVMQGGDIANLSAKSAGEMAADDTSNTISALPKTNIPSNNVNYTAQTGANNVQVVPNNMQNSGQSLTPNLPNVNTNKPNVSVQENVSVSQQAAQAPVSDFKPQTTTDTAKAVEVDTAQPVLHSSTPDTILEEDIKNGKGTYQGLPIKYIPSKSNEASNHTTYIEVGNKFFDLSVGGQRAVLDHEVAHNVSEDIIGSDFENAAIIFLTKKVAPQGSARAGETYYEGIYGNIGATALSESVTEAVREYNNNPDDLRKRSESAYNFIKSKLEANRPTATSLFPTNSLGAKITKGMPQGTGAASKNSLGGMGATKPTRFEINDDTNVDLNNLPQMSNQVVMNPQSKTGNFKTNLSNAYTHIVNVLNPIVKFSKVTGDNTAMLASNSANAGGTVSHIFDNALVDMNGNKIGTSLKEIANKVPKGQEVDFWNYMMQRRNINKAVEDKNVIANFNSRMSAQYAKEVESRNPKWKSIGDEVVKWIADFEQAWGVNSGLIDQEFFNQLKLKDPNYVPAQREFTELESALTGGEVGKKFVDQRTPLKTMQGSERDINNPLENIMRLVNTTVKSARYNQVGQSLLKTIRSNPKASQYGEIVSEDEAKASRANNIVAVIENGQKQYIRINDIALLDALNGIPKSTYTVPVISNLTTAFKKITTQDNPLFGITNLARDLPTGYIYGSQWNPFTYLLNEGKAFGQIAKNGANYQRYKAVGGGMSSFFSSADAETAALNMNKTKNVFQKVGIGFNKFNSMIEEATRLNEFSAVLSKTGDVQKALNAANDVTVNFSRGGDIIKTVDRNGVPYLNASIQGLDKLGKAFKPDRIAKTLFTGAVGITLPTLILYLFNRDNPYYDELSNRTKDTYFVIPNMFGEKDNNGNAMTFIKIPKSRELGMIFGALAERIAREVDGEDEAFKGFAGTLATNISPTNPLESGLIAPLIGLKSNKDFAGRTIIPQSMQDRSKSLQFDEKTSELTKFIAEYAAKAGVELSPKEMDYLIDSWTGVVGDFLLPATTKGANALSPITNKFTADPRYSSQTITNFYENMDEAAKMANDKNFAEGLDSETVTLEEKISSNYAKASKEISALSKTSARAGVETLTDEDVKLLKGYGIDTSAKAQDIQKAIRTQQNEIAKSAISRGTKADEMELDLNNNSTIAKSVEKYQSAGYTQKQAYNIYKTVEALDIDSDSNQAEVAQALEKSNLSNKDKGVVWEIKNGKPSEKNPFTGTLAQAGLAPEKTIAIMEAYSKIDTSIDDNYVKQEGMPGAAQVKAAYLNQWLAGQGYNADQITYITDVFTTWQMIPIDEPSKKANAFVSAYPMPKG